MTNLDGAPSGLRIRPWSVKLAYVVAACAVVYLIAVIPVGPDGAGILRSATAFVLVLLGARLFRAAGEELAPPRPWWRMTGGVQSGIVLGSLVALVAITSATGYVGLTLSTPVKQGSTNLLALLVNTILAAILAYLYYGSSRRLVLERRAETLAAAQKGR
jgi:membrane protease YdiL (CAAX protease family)